VAPWIAAAISLAVALIAAMSAYWNSRLVERRQESLKRVNSQLEELYGPLLALAFTGDAAWKAFRSKFKPNTKYAVTGHELTDEERALWIRWMTHVFMPANRLSVELIRSKAHLVLGEAMPDCFLEMAAHVAGWEVVVKQWEEGNFSELTSILPHPRERYHEHITNAFSTLKRQQQSLLAATDRRGIREAQSSSKS
jgi:hypothetical protein